MGKNFIVQTKQDRQKMNKPEIFLVLHDNLTTKFSQKETLCMNSYFFMRKFLDTTWGISE